MPNKTKAKIRHSKLKAKAENAATESFKKDGGIQKNKRLVTKANKLNERKNLGLPNIAYGMNKEAYALKPVPEGNKGLSKLPTEVRNKMSDEDIQGLMRFLKDGCGMESEPVWLDIHSE